MSFYIVAGEAVGGSRYGYSPAGIVLENVTCQGFESSLGGCSYSPLDRISSPQCRNPSTNAAGVDCFIQGTLTSSNLLLGHIATAFTCTVQ